MITFGDIRSAMQACDWDRARAMDLLAVGGASRETINEYITGYKPAILARCARVALLDHARGVAEGRLALDQIASYRHLGVYAKARFILAKRCPEIMSQMRPGGVTIEGYVSEPGLFETTLRNLSDCATRILQGQNSVLSPRPALVLDLHARFICEALTWAERGWITLDDIETYDMEQCR